MVLLLPPSPNGHSGFSPIGRFRVASHRKVDEQGRKAQKQEATITQLKKSMEVLTASLKEQASQIQKVSEQLESRKSAPRLVANDESPWPARPPVELGD